jgi:hypothetical protein
MALQLESNLAVPCHFKSLNQGRDPGGFDGAEVRYVHRDRVRQWISRQDGLQMIANIWRGIHVNTALQADDGVHATVIHSNFDVG